MKRLLCIIPIVLLTACVTPGPTVPIDAPIPIASMKGCVDMPDIDNPTREALAEWVATVAPLYEVCQADNKALIEWIKRGLK